MGFEMKVFSDCRYQEERIFGDMPANSLCKQVQLMLGVAQVLTKCLFASGVILATVVVLLDEFKCHITESEYLGFGLNAVISEKNPSTFCCSNARSFASSRPTTSLDVIFQNIGHIGSSNTVPTVAYRILKS